MNPYSTGDTHLHMLDLDLCIRHLQMGNDVLVTGYHQRYEILRDSGLKQELRRLLQPMGAPIPIFEPEDLVVHVRIGDYFLPQRNPKFAYPLDDLRGRINGCAYEQLWVASDTPLHPFVQSLKQDLGACIIDAGPLPTFMTLVGAPQLIMSPSSFSWWGGWLGNAKLVFYPNKGVWANACNGNDLWVDDEPRYHRY